MLKVGITGGIGSGKSLISGIFRLLGVPVYNSDQRAKEIMNQNEKVRDQISVLFGTEAYDLEGYLNRSYIASRVFSNAKLLAKLNRIVHPEVGRDFNEWGLRHENHTYVLKEAALIFEAAIDKELDKVVLVFAPEDLRISRVMERDQIDEDEVRGRIVNQWNDNKKAPLADFIIVNDGKQQLLRQTMEIHNFLIQYEQNPAK